MIKGIIEEIKEVNKMIDNHSKDKSDSILEQYQYRRDKLIIELETNIESILDFDNWKDWKNSINL